MIGIGLIGSVNIVRCRSN